MARVLPEVVFVLGAPGSGKGTQCLRAVKHYGFVHLSAGDLLREERQRPGSEYAQMIEQKIRDGEIVPVEVTCALIMAAMKRAAPARRFLVDGFPRNADNLAGSLSLHAFCLVRFFTLTCVCFFGFGRSVGGRNFWEL